MRRPLNQSNTIFNDVVDGRQVFHSNCLPTYTADRQNYINICGRLMFLLLSGGKEKITVDVYDDNLALRSRTAISGWK